MSEATADGTKKAVCRSFAGILKESPLASSIDPKSFFMMLNTNYSALARENEIDLGPIFDALKSNAPEEGLLPVMAKFEQKVNELGMTARLPPTLAGWDDVERSRLVDAYEAQRGLVSVPVSPEEPAGNEHETERHRRIVHAFVQGFRRSPLGERLDPSQLSYFLGEQLGDLLEGHRLRIEPVVDALRQQGVTDAEIYVGLALAGQKIAKLDVELVEPPLDVRPEIRSQLVKRALAREAPARARSTNGQKPDEERKKGLEEFELPTKKAPPGRGRLIRIAVLTALLVGLGTFALWTRGDRPLATGAFRDSVPLSTARMVDGAFSGTIDWEAWSTLPPAEQRARLEAFERVLRRKGWFGDFQLRGPGDDVLALPVEGAVKASPRLYSDFSPPDAGSPEPGEETSAVGNPESSD